MSQKTKLVFEKHFDQTYKRDYFYNVESGESVWELPEDKESYTLVDKNVKD
jgi:hypothetical protein